MWSESILSGVLEEVRWKDSGQNSAPRTLGLDRSTLRARMRRLNILRSNALGKATGASAPGRPQNGHI
jgi:transcriptional regulator with GAF, ATPase, and Fis domain